jgi:hypothetical protein
VQVSAPASASRLRRDGAGRDARPHARPPARGLGAPAGVARPEVRRSAPTAGLHPLPTPGTGPPRPRVAAGDRVRVGRCGASAACAAGERMCVAVRHARGTQAERALGCPAGCDMAGVGGCIQAEMPRACRAGCDTPGRARAAPASIPWCRDRGPLAPHRRCGRRDSSRGLVVRRDAIPRAPMRPGSVSCGLSRPSCLRTVPASPLVSRRSCWRTETEGKGSEGGSHGKPRGWRYTRVYRVDRYIRVYREGRGVSGRVIHPRVSRRPGCIGSGDTPACIALGDTRRCVVPVERAAPPRGFSPEGRSRARSGGEGGGAHRREPKQGIAEGRAPAPRQLPRL